jgi:uncharacterized membrane protein YjjP (DUF1212 family)
MRYAVLAFRRGGRLACRFGAVFPARAFRLRFMVDFVLENAGMNEPADPVLLKHRELERIAMAALKAARLFLESGARVKVVHEGCHLIVAGLGVECVGMRSGYASHEITVSSGINTITRMVSVGPHGVNHRLDHALRALCIKVSHGGMGAEEVEREIDLLVQTTPRYSPLAVAFAVGVACAAFGRLLGIDWAAVGPVFLAGMAGQYLRHILRLRGINVYVAAAAIAFVAAALSGAGALLAGSGTANLAMMASILLLVPGIPATNAMTDILDGFPSMGSARAVTVLVVMVFATVGVFLAEVVLGLH